MKGSPLLIAAVVGLGLAMAWQSWQIRTLSSRVAVLERAGPEASVGLPSRGIGPAVPRRLPEVAPPRTTETPDEDRAVPDAWIRDEVGREVTRALSERHYRQTEAWMQHHEQRLMQHLAELAPEHDLSESTQQRVRARLVDLWWLAAELKESVATGDLTQEEATRQYREADLEARDAVDALLGPEAAAALKAAMSGAE